MEHSGRLYVRIRTVYETFIFTTVYLIFTGY
jgi:hypothetical protein